jgi:uncharacterized protein YbjT (DUF2867 family)
MRIFLAGGTGYLGSRLAEALLARNHSVSGLCRPGSAARLPVGVQAVVGDALRSSSFRHEVPSHSVYVHLIGTPHPAPWKRASFERVDLASLQQAIQAAVAAEATRFVFVSVAHPAPVMRDYIEIRRQCEARIVHSGLPYAILRPWYVLGPGHRWPVILRPVYAIADCFPGSLREDARRLGLVTMEEMIPALVYATESTDPKLTLGVPEIRRVDLSGPDRKSLKAGF